MNRMTISLALKALLLVPTLFVVSATVQAATCETHWTNIPANGGELPVGWVSSGMLEGHYHYNWQCGADSRVRAWGSGDANNYNSCYLDGNTSKHEETAGGGCGSSDSDAYVYIALGATERCYLNAWGNSNGCNSEETRYIRYSQKAEILTSINTTVKTMDSQAITMRVGTKNTSGNFQTDRTGISGNNISWVKSGSSACYVSGSGASVTINYGNQDGTCVITANVSGNTDLAPTSVSTPTINITHRSQTINVTNSLTQPSMPALSQDTVAASAAGGNVVISTSGGCSGGGSNTATITADSATAACQVTFSAPQTDYYYAATNTPVVQSTTVTKLNQSITFGAQAAHDYSPSGTFSLSPMASATSGYVIDYSSGTPSVCSVSIVGVVSILSAGTCTIHADQPGDVPIYNAATRVSQNITINKIAQNITVTTPAPSNAQVTDTFTVAATANSGLPVAITTSGGCTGSGSGSALVTVVGTSDCIVYYNQTGNSNYNAATQVTSTTNITKPLQTMTVTSPAPSQAYVGDIYTVSAISYIKGTSTPTGLGVAITIDATDNGCSINSGGTNTAEILLTSGTTPCKILYNQDGGGAYEPAPEQSNTTTAIRIAQLINVTQAAPASKNIRPPADPTFTVSATASSPDGVTITASGGCTGSGTNSAIITMTSYTSSCTVTYTQPGDDDYYPAATVSSVTRDGTAPLISEVTPVPAQTNANPVYTLNSDEAGSIIYGGSCTASADAIAGDTTIEFNTLAEGVYSDCTVRVRDAAGNLSNALSLGTFTVVPDKVAFVKVGGAGDCSSWANACSDIQTAFADTTVSEVWIAEGIYRPSSTIVLKGGLAIYGGFAGTETSRVATGGLTIISGDTGADDIVNADGLVMFSANVNGTNLNRLMSATDLNNLVSSNKSVLLSGLSLNAAGGTAGGTVNGAGLLVSNSEVIANNVQFITLRGSAGGAVSVSSGGHFITADSSFIRNESTGVGGAISVTTNSSNEIDITRSLFDSNTGGTSGGAINHPAGIMTVSNTTFFGNAVTSSSGDGGAINFASIDNPGNASIKFSTFVSNSAGASSGRGGAISIDASGVTGQVGLASSLILENTAASGANIAGMNNINDSGYNVVGYNGDSGMVKNGGTPHDFVGTSTTAPSVFVDDIIETTLANNGGLTANLLLKSDSYAKDRMPNIHADCSSGTALGVDQRGMSRPAVDAENCDIGAYEAEPVVSCSDPNREKGYSLSFYPSSNMVCVGGASLLSGGVVHPFYLLMLAVLGLIGARRSLHPALQETD